MTAASSTPEAVYVKEVAAAARVRNVAVGAAKNAYNLALKDANDRYAGALRRASERLERHR